MLSWPSAETHKDVGSILILSENIIRNVEADAFVCSDQVLVLLGLNLFHYCSSQDDPITPDFKPLVLINFQTLEHDVLMCFKVGLVNRIGCYRTTKCVVIASLPPPPPRTGQGDT